MSNLVNNLGCVESNKFQDVVDVYKKMSTVLKKGRIITSAFESKLARTRDEAFRDILKTIILDNAVCTEKGKIKLNSTLEKIFSGYNGIKPMYLEDKSFEKCVSTAVDSFRNWIGEWKNGKISIHSTTPSSSYIIKDRAKLIDFLLYFNHKQYIGTFKERVEKFESDLSKFGFSDGALYIMRWHDFCVRAAFKLAKDDENVYELFYRIYNNQDFKDIKSAPATQIEEDNYEEFTNSIMIDFNNINAYGSIDDSAYVNANESLTLYQFVKLHRLAFDRAHLSSYRIWCYVVLTGKMPESLSNGKWEVWDDSDREIRAQKALDKLRINNTFLNGELDEVYERANNLSYFYREDSISKELMIWTLILCLNSEGLKGYCTRSELGNPESIAMKIILKIDKILGIVGMSLLNGNFSEAEFLLVNAIYHIDYKKLYNSQETYYPFREYVLNIRNSAV